MKFSSILKRTAMAAVTAASLASVVTPAEAIVLTEQNAYLIVYGNNKEGYKDLGSWNNLRDNGGSFDVSAILNSAGITGTNPVEYTIIGFGGGVTLPMRFGAEVSDVASFPTLTLSLSNFRNAFVAWGGQLGLVNDPTQAVYDKGTITAWSSYFNGQDNDQLNNSVPVRGASDIGNFLNLFERTGAASTLQKVQTAFLDGTTKFLTVGAAPVPVPAAAVLFASGVVGLIGLARRSMSRLAN